jgi:UDP:flavonoid glycosyltransferase YjiC (YdhE family)
MPSIKGQRRLLFFGEEVTLAHVTRPLVLAGFLDHQRYDILFACGNKYRGLVEASGYRMFPVPTIPPDTFLKRLARGAPLYTHAELQEYVNAELKLCTEIAPDLIIGDFRLSLGITAEVLNIPYIALTNAHWSPHSTLPFPLPEHRFVKLVGPRLAGKILPFVLPAVFWHHARAFNKLRRSFGLRPVGGGLKEIYTHGSWTLYTDIPSVAPIQDILPTQRYIGPVIWSPAINLPDWWQELPDDRPIIYVTMGSSGDIRLLDTILEVLGGMPVVGVVATAGRTTVVRKPANVFIEEYLPGVEVTRRSSLVICNGGSATVYQALSMGKPVLGFPSNADQFFTMESVQRLDAGISVRPMATSSETVRNALRTILGDVRFKEAAERLKQEIGHYDSRKLFPDFIDQWAEGKIPTKT